MDRVRLAILTLILLLWATSVHAGTVAIVRLPTPTPDLTEVLSRLHGELLSVGLEVKMIDRPVDRGLSRADVRTWLQETAAEGGIDAIIAVVGETTPVAVDIWVIEKLPRRLEVSRVSTEPNTRNASERLAIRAVEVLRSTFLENDMASRERHDEPRAKPATTSLPSTAEHDEPASNLERFGVAAGVAAVTSLDGVGPAIMPVARFDWAARPWLVVQATAAGFGSRPMVATTAGTARVTQQYGILGGCYRFRSDKRLQPFLTLSAGLLHTLVEGQADSPRQGHHVNQRSFLLDASLGADLRLVDHYYLTLAVHVQMANPYVAIHITDAVVGTSGHPNFVLTLTVGAWL